MSPINGIPLKEDKALVSRIEDLAYRAINNQTHEFTDFLDIRQLDVAKGVLKHFGFSDFVNFGGFENSERSLLCISQNEVDYSQFPICCIKISYNSEKKLSHRDFLGSILSLGIKREKIGDISVFEDSAYIAIFENISKVILSELKSVGSQNVKCTLSDEFINNDSDMSTIRASVSSLRLDAIIASVLKMSRENARALIKKSGVRMNCRDVFAPDAKMFKDDVFSVKGYGKYVLSDIIGYSKKGKIIISIKKYN